MLSSKYAFAIVLLFFLGSFTRLPVLDAEHLRPTALPVVGNVQSTRPFLRLDYTVREHPEQYEVGCTEPLY